MLKTLKRNKTIRAANAAVKNAIFNYETRRLERRYADCFNEVPPCRKLRTDTPNIFFVGTDYGQDKSGLYQAVSSLGPTRAFVNSGYGLKSGTDNSESLLKQVGDADLLIGQMWAPLVSVEALKEIQSKGTIVVNFAWDDKLPLHWRKGKGAIGIAAGVDLTLNSSPEMLKRYAAEGYYSVYCPLASDPIIFQPRSCKIRDVCFVGSKYGIRGKIVEAIEKSGVKVTCYGNGWPRGPIPAWAMPAFFSNSCIVLGVGAVAHSNVTTLKLRDFDGPMSGSFYLTQHNPDLEALYEIGREIDTYKSIKDCVEKVHYYLKRPTEREYIARRGRTRAVKCHTWDIRMKAIMELLRA